ncbi:hypothetical protein HID58_095936 [Brassica napus]|uniref:Uncharacterized protein n=1 Tax=Brassica napus TaxID=3708 RepID=A0ABQ7X2B9_BRANA|nr:hypothetical protein HID58_095936 [Brassica napus]
MRLEDSPVQLSILASFARPLSDAGGVWLAGVGPLKLYVLSPLIPLSVQALGFVRLLVLVGEHCDCFRGLAVYVLGFSSAHRITLTVLCLVGLRSVRISSRFHRHLHRSCSCSHRLSRRRRFSVETVSQGGELLRQASPWRLRLISKDRRPAPTLTPSSAPFPATRAPVNVNGTASLKPVRWAYLLVDGPGGRLVYLASLLKNSDGFIGRSVGPEDAADLVSTIFRGADWISTSLFNLYELL